MLLCLEKYWSIGALDHYATFSTVKFEPGDNTRPLKLLEPGPPALAFPT